MGFGEKVDFRTNRTLNLDKTYRIIRDAVESAGLECIRADDIVHSGLIDKPMYENLLNADVAIADLSTSNENAIYELGAASVLYGSKIILFKEDKVTLPSDFSDIGHITFSSDGIVSHMAELLKELRAHGIIQVVVAS